MRRWGALLAALALAVGVLILGAASPAWAEVGACLPNPMAPNPCEGQVPGSDPAGGHQAGINPDPIGAIGDALCPKRNPPTPEPPNIFPGGEGPGPFGTYGSSGLYWTTFDQGCFAVARADTGLGVGLNNLANSVDDVTNENQAAALVPAQEDVVDATTGRAFTGLHDAFWNVWSLPAVGLLGILAAIRIWRGRETDALSALVGALAVAAVMGFMLHNPDTPRDASNMMTSGVAARVGASLNRFTPQTTTLPKNLTPQQRYTEQLHQQSVRAWLDGAFCGDAAAERKYGDRLRWTQAYTVAEWRRASADKAYHDRIVAQKNDAWVAMGADMMQNHPTVFECWSGAANIRTTAGFKHMIVAFSSGFWINLGAIIIQIFRWMLRLAVLLFAAFGAIMLFSPSMTEGMLRYGMLGLFGPPIMAVLMGVLLWANYAILLDPQTSWIKAPLSAFSLGVAIWFSKNHLGRIFLGAASAFAVGGMARHYYYRSRNRLRPYRTHTGPVGHAGAAGISAAGAGASSAGAAAGSYVAGRVGAAARLVGWKPDGPRDDDDGRAHVPTDDVRYYAEAASHAGDYSQPGVDGYLPTRGGSEGGQDWRPNTEPFDPGDVAPLEIPVNPPRRRVTQQYTGTFADGSHPGGPFRAQYERQQQAEFDGPSTTSPAARRSRPQPAAPMGYASVHNGTDLTDVTDRDMADRMSDWSRRHRRPEPPPWQNPVRPDYGGSRDDPLFGNPDGSDPHGHMTEERPGPYQPGTYRLRDNADLRAWQQATGAPRRRGGSGDDRREDDT